MFRRGGNWCVSLRGDWGILAPGFVTGCSVEKTSIAPASTKTTTKALISTRLKNVIKNKTSLNYLRELSQPKSSWNQYCPLVLVVSLSFYIFHLKHLSCTLVIDNIKQQYMMSSIIKKCQISKGAVRRGVYVETLRWIYVCPAWQGFLDLTAGCLGICWSLGGVRGPQTLLCLCARVCYVSALRNNKRKLYFKKGPGKRKHNFNRSHRDV